MTGPEILLVEDDDAVRRTFASALGSFGYSVTEASSGHEALRQVARRRPGVVLSDVYMTDGDGFELLDGMKSWPGVPVLLMTGAPSPEDAARAMAGGAFAYLRKVAPPEEIVAAIEAALAARGPDP